MSELCRCGEDPATVHLRNPDGGADVVVCRRCAATLELLMKLLGERTVRRPLLTLVSGAVE